MHPPRADAWMQGKVGMITLKLKLLAILAITTALIGSVLLLGHPFSTEKQEIISDNGNNNERVVEQTEETEAKKEMASAKDAKETLAASLSLIALPDKIETHTDEQVADLIQKIEEQITEPLPAEAHPTETVIQTVQQREEVSTPPPLEVEIRVPEAFLTQAGVIQRTNIRRVEQGFVPLQENVMLNASAAEKVRDMFAGQYFAHESPSGAGAGNLAKNTGYEFIFIGENLALGDFQNDEVLVQAWMDSPGHRANILNSRYQEIGVAVGKGSFNGRTTWLAVQHFALPLSACSQPNETMKIAIESNQSQIEQVVAALQNLRVEMRSDIRSARPGPGERWRRLPLPIDGQKVEEYNELVSQYNALMEETRSLVNQYNNQVDVFNQCVAGT